VPSPASDHLIIRPGSSDFRIKPQQQMQMVIHNRESTDGHRKDLREFLEPVLQPLLAIVVSFTQQERAANTARYAVIPVGKRDIDQLGPSDRHRESPGGGHTSTVRRTSRPVEIVFPARRPKSTSQSIEPPAIDGKALQCGSFLTLSSEESKAQCLSTRMKARPTELAKELRDRHLGPTPWMKSELYTDLTDKILAFANETNTATVRPSRRGSMRRALAEFSS
jgi:hypothetical protein